MRITDIDLATYKLRIDDLARGFNVVHLPAANVRRDVLAAIRASLSLPSRLTPSISPARIRWTTAWGRAQWKYEDSEAGAQALAENARLRRMHRKLRAAVRKSECRALIGPRWGDAAALNALAKLFTPTQGSPNEQSVVASLVRDLQASRSLRQRDELVQSLRVRESELLAEIEQTQHPAPAGAQAASRHVARWQSRLAIVERKLEHVNRLWRRVQLQRTTMVEQQRQQQLQQWEQQIERLQLVLDDVHRRARELAKLRSEHVEPDAAWEKESAELQQCHHNLQARMDSLNARCRELRQRAVADDQLLNGSRFVARLQQKLSELENRREICLRKLQATEPQPAPTTTIGVDAKHLDALQSQLREVRAQLEQHAEQEMRDAAAMWQRLRTSMRHGGGPLPLDAAAGNLRKLSDQTLVGLRVDAAHHWLVEQADGRTVSVDVLSHSERVQVHLALCVALSADVARRGVILPLIVNDVTRQLPPASLPATLELLRDHSQSSVQTLLLTSQAHVASLSRSSTTAAQHTWTPPVATPQPHVEPAKTSSQPATAPARAHNKPIQETNSWECEEFPGELRDRVRRDAAAVSAPPPASSSAPHVSSTSARREAPAMHAGEQLRQSGHYLELCDRVREIPFIDPRITQVLEGSGVYTVANLLHVDAARLCQRLRDDRITATQVRQWQAQAALMCGVPRMRSYDARILVACGISSPQQLADIHPRELLEMIEAFVATPDGSQLVRGGQPQEVARLTGWMQRLRREQATRRGDTPAPTQSPPAAKPTRFSAVADVLPLKFYLELGSEIEAAPAIGPTTAKRLEAGGITTVRDFLAADPEQLAKSLGQRRMSAATLRQWQLQAALVCAVPELRGHDAQLLVACDISSAKQLAASEASSLFTQVRKLARSKAGQRILRGGGEPTVAEVEAWIRAAGKARKLAA